MFDVWAHFGNFKLIVGEPDLVVGDSQGLSVCNNMCYQLIRSMCYHSEKGKILKASFVHFPFHPVCCCCRCVSDDSSSCSCRESAGNLWMISSSSQFSEIASNWNSSTHSQMLQNWKDTVILILWNGFQLSLYRHTHFMNWHWIEMIHPGDWSFSNLTFLNFKMWHLHILQKLIR